MTLEKSKSILCGLAGLLLFWGLFHFRALFGGQTFVMEDASSFCYPLWKYGADVFAQGLIPLWNSAAAFGTPYLADPQMAAWYPPVRVFYLWLSPENAFRFLILVHHLWAMLGFWFFARGRGYSNFSSLAGAVVFGFSMHSICLFGNPAILFSFSWIPWVFGTAERPFNKTHTHLLSLSVCAAMQLVSGYPLVFYLTVLFVVFDLLLKLFKNLKGFDWLEFFEMAGKLGLALGLAIGFNLVWLIPFEEFRQFSNVAARLQVTQGLPFDFLRSFLNPFCAKTMDGNLQVPFWISCFYVGLPTLAIVLWATLRGKVRLSSLALFLLALVLSLGESAKLGDWFRYFVPFYGWVARSGCLMPMVVFFAANLTAECLESVRTPENKRTDSIFFWLSALVFGLAIYEGVFAGFWPLWAALAFVLLAGLGRFSFRVRAIFFLISVLFSLWPFDQMMYLTLDRSFYEKKPAVLNVLKPVGRLYQSPEIVNAFQVSPGKNLGDSFNHLKENLIPDIPLNFGVEEICYKNSLYLNSFLRWYLLSGEMKPKPLEKLLSYWDVKYVMGRTPFPDFENRGVDDLNTRLDENPAPFSKWFSVPEALAAGEWAADADEVKSGQFDFKNKCWIADKVMAGSYSRRLVSELVRTPEGVELQASGTGKALLVSSETAYPGWKARTAQEWHDVEDVNHGFRGVILKEGEEKVTLAYRPTSFRLGCFCSLLVSAFWLFLLLNFPNPKRMTNELS